MTAKMGCQSSFPATIPPLTILPCGESSNAWCKQRWSELPLDYREAVILRDLEEMDYREIAQVLRVPEGTVKWRISRGRANSPGCSNVIK